MVLVALTGGVLYTEAAPQGTGRRTWTAEFLVSAGSGPVASGTAPDGATSSGTINFEQFNITEVTFQFSFTDNYRFATVSPAGATFKVTSPTGLFGESTLSPGQTTATSITIREVTGVPDGTEFIAATQAEAANLTRTRYPANENGTGIWTIDVTVTRDYMTPIHAGGSIAWTASSRVETYTLDLSEKLSG